MVVDNIRVPTSEERNSNEGARLAWEAKVMERWADICMEKHHPRCLRTTDYLPTRLIDVGTAEQRHLRLITTSGQELNDASYIALSHCWGTSMPEAAKTTTANLAQHHDTIDYSTLPFTFRDCIDIARRIGIRHVWIDSVCIIQDSGEDWNKEAAQMASVYSNSYLTFAASSSSNGQGGCRVRNPRKHYGPVDVPCLKDRAHNDYDEINQWSKWSKRFKMYKLSDMDTHHRQVIPVAQKKTFRVWTYNHTEEREVLSEGPLAKRGWTLQEAMLSPRLVHFCDSTIVWECRCARATTSFPWDEEIVWSNGSATLTSDFSWRTPGLRNVEWCRFSNSNEQFEAWTKIVASYRDRRLTKPEDMLPAIAGIAQTIATRTGDEYYAGLWKSRFAHCLLWQSFSQRADKVPQHMRQCECVAPSWSWASMRGEIDYAHWTLGMPPTAKLEEHDASLEPELLEVKLIATSIDNPYGRLKSGHLKIRGKVKRSYSFQTHGRIWDPAFDPGQTLKLYGSLEKLDAHTDGRENEGYGEGEGVIRYDVPLCEACAPFGTVREILVLRCIGFVKDDQLNESLSSAIVLEVSEHSEGVYVRTGVAWELKPEFWDGAETKEVIIE